MFRIVPCNEDALSKKVSLEQSLLYGPTQCFGSALVSASADPDPAFWVNAVQDQKNEVPIVSFSVADPDPQDPHVFGPPGSGSTSQRYGSGSGSCSGSGSFYHHAKIVRKTLIPNILLLFLTFYL